MNIRSIEHKKPLVVCINGVRPAVSNEIGRTPKSEPTLFDKGREQYLRLLGYEVVPLFTDWSYNRSYQDDLNEATTLVAEIAQDRKNITIVADSAGVGKAINIMHELPEVPINALLICGRVREGNYQNHNPKSLIASASKRRSTLYVDSVRNAEKHLDDMGENVICRMRVVNSSRDGVVPIETSEIIGAQTTTIGVPGHVASILGVTIMMPKFLSDLDIR